MVEIIEYDRGKTVRIENTYTDIDDVVYDPTTIELFIYEPNGSLNKTVNYAASEIIRSDEGIYYYDYDIASDAIIGSWITKWIATSGTFTDVSKNQFRVRDSEEKLYTTVEEVWNRAGLDENVATRNEIIPLIKDSMSEIDAMMGKSFSYATEKTQWIDTNRPDPATKVKNIYLLYTPVISVTSLEEYDTSGDLITTHEASDYWINLNTGRIRLHDDEFVKQVHRVKIVYTYGAIQIPRNISSLCTILSAMRLFIYQIGGTFDDITSYSTCGLNMSVGEPYMNMSRDLEFLTKEANRLIANIGRLRPSAMIL